MGILSWLGIGKGEKAERGDTLSLSAKSGTPENPSTAITSAIQKDTRSKIGDLANEKSSNPYEEKAKELNKRDGGIKNRLEKIIKQYASEKQVDEEEYEGLLRFMMKEGISNNETKLYFLVAGLAHGLVSHEQLAALNSEYINTLPWLDFFSDKSTAKPFTLDESQSSPRELSSGDIRSMYGFFLKNPKTNPKRFLEKKILTHEVVQRRITKAAKTKS